MPQLREHVGRLRVTGLRARLSQRGLVGVVDQDPGASLVEGPGQSDVIRVGVRQDQGLDIAEPEPERGEIGLEGSTEARESGVDSGQAPSVFDQIPVEEVVAEAMNAGNDVLPDGDDRDPSASGRIRGPMRTKATRA
jgi:hypothetical protein